MKKGFRFFVGFLILIFSLVSVFGCAGTSPKDNEPKQEETKKEEPVTITFTNWVSAEEGTRNQISEIIAEFEKENPNIKVDVKPIPVSDIAQQLVIMASADNPPDISQVLSNDIFTLAASEFLEPVDGLASEAFVKDIPQNVFDATGLVDGKHYGIPWASTMHGFYYNKKLMQEAGLDPNNPPKTMDELDSMMAQAKGKLPKDVIMIQLDTTIRTLGLFHQWPFMLAFNDGVPPVDGNNVNVNTEGMKKYGEWIRKQNKDGNTLPGKKYGEFRPHAAQNKLLFGIDGSFLPGTMQALNKELTPEEVYETWGVSVLPGSNGESYSGDLSHSLAIFKGSKHKEEAMKFAEYLVNSDYSLKKYLAAVGFVPVTQSAIDRVPELSNPITDAFVNKVVPTSVSLPYGPNYNMVAEVIMASVQEIITTDKPVGEILDKAQKQLEQALK